MSTVCELIGPGEDGSQDTILGITGWRYRLLDCELAQEWKGIRNHRSVLFIVLHAAGHNNDGNRPVDGHDEHAPQISIVGAAHECGIVQIGGVALHGLPLSARDT